MLKKKKLRQKPSFQIKNLTKKTKKNENLKKNGKNTKKRKFYKITGINLIF